MSKDLILITVIGEDHPGITSTISERIIKYNCTPLDMGQSIIHGLLSLTFLLDLHQAKEEAQEHPLIADLKECTSKMGMRLKYHFIKDKKQITPTGDRYILNCINLSGLSTNFIHDISKALASHNINIQRIDNIKPNEFIALEMTTLAQSENVNWEEVKVKLMAISTAHDTDLALLKDDVWRRNKRLIVFDMDSTLIQNEVIVEMARIHGVHDQVHNITERAMNGEFNFEESLRSRVTLLKGLEESKLHELLNVIKLTDGVQDFIKTIKALGYKVAIISGGFNFFAQALKKQLGLDYAFANELEIVGGKLTGNLKGHIVGANTKAMLLEMIAQQEGIQLEQVVAIGDGANDLEMLSKAGLGIAFHAKEVVKKSASHHMSHGPMTTILYFLGIPGALSGHDV